MDFFLSQINKKDKHYRKHLFIDVRLCKAVITDHTNTQLLHFWPTKHEEVYLQPAQIGIWWVYHYHRLHCSRRPDTLPMYSHVVLKYSCPFPSKCVMNLRWRRRLASIQPCLDLFLLKIAKAKMADIDIEDWIRAVWTLLTLSTVLAEREREHESTVREESHTVEIRGSVREATTICWRRRFYKTPTYLSQQLHSLVRVGWFSVSRFLFHLNMASRAGQLEA